MAPSGSILGNPVLRKEDPGILEGTTQYYDDLSVAGLLHTAFIRSTVAPPTIAGIDTGKAHHAPSARSDPWHAAEIACVVVVFVAADFDLPAVHGFMMLPPTMNRPPLAQ